MRERGERERERERERRRERRRVVRKGNQQTQKRAIFGGQDIMGEVG